MKDVWGRAVLSARRRRGASASRTPAVQTPESLTGERFPRRVRLARGPELAACWEQGRRLRTPHLDLAWRPSPLDHPRMAIVVPRFQFTAVARNRLRRRLKEILRRYPVASLPVVDLVVRANAPRTPRRSRGCAAN